LQKRNDLQKRKELLTRLRKRKRKPRLRKRLLRRMPGRSNWLQKRLKDGWKRKNSRRKKNAGRKSEGKRKKGKGRLPG